MMTKDMKFNPENPYDNLPHIPPSQEKYETIWILKQEGISRAAIAELKGIANIIPNQAILINAIVLQEAKDSSEIENIITTQDELYRAITLRAKKDVDPTTKEVVNYREALKIGSDTIKKRGFLSINDIIEIQKIIVENDAGIRKTPGTALMDDANNETIYTPPQDQESINHLLRNFAEYLNDKDDSLMKAAILHYQFEAIHPFYDGNGRTGRILNILYLLMKRHLEIPILYLSSYIINHKSEYYRLLLEVTNSDIWEKWILYFLKGIEVTAKEAILKIQAINEMIYGTIEIVKEKAPKIYSKELVETLFIHPYCKNEFIVEALGVERKAASRYLHNLEEIGLLKRHKIGRENIYFHTDLMSLLQQL
jgi:Fic family protein